MDEDVPDPRTEKKGICGVTFTGSTGIEWVCIRDTHSQVYFTKRGPRISDGPQAEQHHFVNKWPNRPTKSGVEEGFFDAQF